MSRDQNNIFVTVKTDLHTLESTKANGVVAGLGNEGCIRVLVQNDVQVKGKIEQLPWRAGIRFNELPQVVNSPNESRPGFPYVFYDCAHEGIYNN